MKTVVRKKPVIAVAAVIGVKTGVILGNKISDTLKKVPDVCPVPKHRDWSAVPDKLKKFGKRFRYGGSFKLFVK